MITKPELPPRKGFVEVEVNGERVYRAVSPAPAPEPVTSEPTAEQLQAKITMLEAQQTFLEDCILEMADEVYA